MTAISTSLVCVRSRSSYIAVCDARTTAECLAMCLEISYESSEPAHALLAPQLAQLLQRG